jgi:isoleucyl-tRNA synthetase
MDNYDMHIALKAMEDLIEDLSNFYLRLSRRRFWAETLDRQKEEAYSVLFYALETVTLMLAPLAPFYSEYLYRKLHPESESVHLEKFPEVMSQMINHDLEAEVSRAEAILEATRRIRQDHGIKGRQPVTEVLVSSTTEIGNELLEIISPELNARTVRFVDENEWPVVRKIALKTKEAAPLLRKDLNMVRETLDHDDGTLALQFSSSGSVKVGEHIITGEIAEIFMEPKAGYAMDHEPKSGITVFVNLKRDQALMNEGLARELVRRIQVMRKEMNLQYDETIDVAISGPDEARVQLAEHTDWMGKETLASTLQFINGIEGRKWDIDGEIFIIRIVPTETVK